MIPFLRRTARHLVETFPDNLSEVCVVLPNRRAGVFLRKFLAEEAAKTTWSPTIYSIEDFARWISGLQEASPLALLLGLFEVYRESEGVKAQTFEEFLRWGPQLLSDFDEVDRYLADPELLFTTLTEARAISVWNPDGRALTDFEKSYLEFYRSMLRYYRALTGRMKENGTVGQGLAYRVAAEKSAKVAEALPWRHVIFAGFNALTRAEEMIIGNLRDKGKATLLWDMDRYYINDEHQESGDFLRSWMRKWPVREPRWISDDLSNEAKEIEIIGSPDPVGMVKMCGRLLAGLAEQGMANEKTAVVLLDESLLMPLLNSIPPGVEALNITAGWALNQTPVAGLFEIIFRMHLRQSRFMKPEPGNKAVYYYKDVLKLLQHPYVRQMVATGPGGHSWQESLMDRVRMGRKTFLGLSDLDGNSRDLFTHSPECMEAIFKPWSDAADVIACLKSVIVSIRSSGVGTFDLEYLYAFSCLLHQIGNLITVLPSGTGIPALYELYRQAVAATTLPFSGEPLHGVQLMGMLETRALDFDHVILLSCNEGILPAAKAHASFIPFDIKRDFGLPTYRHKDSVYAYHFYRLIQRAGRIWILYNTEPDQLGGGEPSRFIRQITAELRGRNPKVSIRESVLAPSLPAGSAGREVTVAKTAEVASLLGKKASSGLSASSLNAYRNCPLKFYYAEVAGIREPEETDDTIDPAVLGTAVHEVLNRLFLPTLNHPLSPGDLDEMEKISAGAVTRAFGKKFRGGDIRFGKNRLLVSVADLMVRRFLRYQKAELSGRPTSSPSLTVTHLEKYLETSLPVRSGSNSLDVRIKGVIDRVDESGGSTRIIDYKTGAALQKNVRIDDWEALRSGIGHNEGFQLMLYAWLLGRVRGTLAPMSAGIIPLRRLSEGFIALTVPGEGSGKGTARLDPSAGEQFEEILTGILTEIFDLSQPFTQTSDTDACRYCPYVNLCLR